MMSRMGVLFLGAITFSAQAMCAGQAPRERLNADANWRFLLGDPAGAGDRLAQRGVLFGANGAQRNALLPAGGAFGLVHSSPARLPLI